MKAIVYKLFYIPFLWTYGAFCFHFRAWSTSLLHSLSLYEKKWPGYSSKVPIVFHEKKKEKKAWMLTEW